MLLLTNIKQDQSELNFIINLPHSPRDCLITPLTLQYALRSQSKISAIRSKETEPDKEGRPAGATVSRRRCTDHPQEWEVLYLPLN